MNNLTRSQNDRCTAIVARITKLQRLLNEKASCASDTCSLFTYLAAMKEVQGHIHNDLGFLSTLLAKEWLCKEFPGLGFGSAEKAQGARGLDIELCTANGERIVAEIKNTVPCKRDGDFGANQINSISNDVSKLKEAEADHKFFFVTNEKTFNLLKGKHKSKTPQAIEIVLLS